MSSTFTIEKVPDAPVLISTALPAWHAGRDFQAFADELLRKVEQCSEPRLIYIADLRQWTLDVGQLIAAANSAARGSGAILHHPRIAEFVVVTELHIVELAARGLESEVFGQVPVRVFEGLDQALIYARSRAGVLAAN